MTIHFETLGCKLNQIESESAAKAFYDQGYIISSKNLTRASGIQKDIGLAIINTCTVTGKAEQKARRLINMLLDLCPDAPIIVTGCYAELDGAYLEEIDNRVIILPGSKKGYLTDLAEAFPASSLQKNFHLENLKEWIDTKTREEENLAFRLSTDVFFSHSRASLKIQDGCNSACSYCRVRLARGKAISLDAETICDRIRELIEKGHKEVVLTGINLSQYLCPKTKMGFTALLDYLIKNTDGIAFRISSLYPQSVDEAFCELIQSERIRPHFHLSVQSGSDKILKAMKRPYNAKKVSEAVHLIRKAKEDVFIATDIIVGFPGESEEDFLETLSLCKELNFAWIHVFPFSARPGTEAFLLKNTISAEILQKRVILMTELAKEQKKAFVLSQVGKKRLAIVEKRRSIPARAVCDNFLHVELSNLNTKEAQMLAGQEVRTLINHYENSNKIDARACVFSKSDVQLSRLKEIT